MEVRTDRVGLLVEQLAESMEFSKARMEGMTDDENLREPVPGMWSVRRRGVRRPAVAALSHSAGRGRVLSPAQTIDRQVFAAGRYSSVLT